MTADALATGLAVSLLALAAAATWCALPHKIATRLPFLPVAGLFALHSVVTAQMIAADWPLWAAAVVRLALFGAAVWFWLPVLGSAPRLEPAVRTLYLFLAGPLLDLPALAQIAAGAHAAGVAMIVGMLPIPLAAVTSFCLWMRAEERAPSVPPEGRDRVSAP
jgi:hypothetical protein